MISWYIRTYPSKFTNLPMLASCSSASPQLLTSEKVRIQWTHMLKLAALTCTSLRTWSLIVLQHLKKMSGSCGWILSSTRRSNLLSADKNWSLTEFCVAMRDETTDGLVSTGRLPSEWEPLGFKVGTAFSTSLPKKGDQMGALDDWVAPMPILSSKNNTTSQSRCVFTTPACDCMRSEIPLEIWLWVARR